MGIFVSKLKQIMSLTNKTTIKVQNIVYPSSHIVPEKIAHENDFLTNHSKAEVSIYHRKSSLH